MNIKKLVTIKVFFNFLLSATGYSIFFYYNLPTNVKLFADNCFCILSIRLLDFLEQESRVKQKRTVDKLRVCYCFI